jgi:hypothetical protein
VIEWEINTVNKRPELQLFDLQSEQIEISKNTISKKVIYPKSMLLRRQVTKPGLNIDNSFQTFTWFAKANGMCLIGINQKRKDALLISEAIVTTEKNLLLNTNLQLRKWKK